MLAVSSRSLLLAMGFLGVYHKRNDRMNAKNRLTSVIREVTPPFMFRPLRGLVHRIRSSKSLEQVRGSWGERPAEWYDAVYKSSMEYRKHYSESRYYFLWTVVVDRMMHHGIRNVLDLGCGPGQFASLMYDKGFRAYCGVDISSECIALAQKTCPEFEFIAADVIETKILESRDYDGLIALEFLEHILEDTGVLKRISPGTRFLGTVPNFPYISHVRHFANVDEVQSRYAHLFKSLRVDVFRENPLGSSFFLMDGVKN